MKISCSAEQFASLKIVNENEDDKILFKKKNHLTKHLHVLLFFFFYILSANIQ